jgi:UDP-N-acetyl-D-galactosamine dehydrogenase
MKNQAIAVIGLGYVGLPLALEFGKKFKVIGFDTNQSRIKELKNAIDKSLETTPKDFKKSTFLSFTNKLYEIRNCKIFIITVPTPIDKQKNPDLTFLKKSCDIIGSILKKNDIVIFESTVYPGVTEEICAPILQKKSGLIFNIDFFCGYSPERINPGDKEHRLPMIKKITSGSNPRIAIKINNLYKKIIKAGTYMAPNIKVAEAAKVIENIQRDLNIALINELSMIFKKLNIDTKSVLDAAKTKWNFLPFKPGLVGGHCIGIDPYYLSYKALKVGHKPEMIISGRKINENMSFYVASEVKKFMKKKNIKIINAKALIMGLTFKENCPDIRNSKIFDLISELKKSKMDIDVYDPWVEKEEVINKFDICLTDKPKKGKYDLIIMAVAHDKFKKFSFNRIRNFGKKKNVIYDIKQVLNINKIDGSL